MSKVPKSHAEGQRGIFTSIEKICLYITNLVFWVVIYAVVDSHYEGDAVSMFFGSIVVSTIFLILQEAGNYGKEKDDNY